MNKWLLAALVLSLTLNGILLAIRREPVTQQVVPLADSTEDNIRPAAQAPAVTSSPLSVSDLMQEERSSAATLQAWFNNDDPRFFPALTAALRDQPYNWELLLLEAMWVKREEPLSEAIIQYYKILERNPPPQVEQDISALITQMADTAAEKLRLAGDWDTLAAFVEPLYQYRPEDRFYTLQLAEAYGRQQKFTLMENVLASLPSEDRQAEALRRVLYPQTADAQSEDTPPTEEKREVSGNAYRMPLEQTGDHYLAPLTLNGRHSRLLVDTGASVTTVTTEVFRQVARRGNYRDLGNFAVNTAGGRVDARMVTLKEVEFGPWRLADVSVLVLPPGTLDGTEGLLGMNILKRFHFRIDQAGNALLLDPIH
ncbi:clan AA aspartic protease [Alteromonas sp. NFXS44]|uniref:retropepsin-like aspartic protease family protein n=1 Tax=Alteromonas sp. NFXS44 TaxID=2818435 RepID=UPI0032DF0B67